MEHAEARDIAFAHHIEDAPPDSEARVDAIGALLGIGVRSLAGHEVLDVARREEQVVLIGGENQARGLRAVHLLQRDDVGAEPVAILA